MGKIRTNFLNHNISGFFSFFAVLPDRKKNNSSSKLFVRRDRCLSNHSRPLWTGSHYESRDRNIVSSAYFQIDFASERFECEIC